MTPNYITVINRTESVRHKVDFSNTIDGIDGNKFFKPCKEVRRVQSLVSQRVVNFFLQSFQGHQPRCWIALQWRVNGESNGTREGICTRVKYVSVIMMYRKMFHWFREEVWPINHEILETMKMAESSNFYIVDNLNIDGTSWYVLLSLAKYRSIKYFVIPSPRWHTSSLGARLASRCPVSTSPQASWSLPLWTCPLHPPDLPSNTDHHSSRQHSWISYSFESSASHLDSSASMSLKTKWR